MNVSYIKSFSQGQITVPKSVRDALGIGHNFWLKVYTEGNKIVAEPVTGAGLSKDEYLAKLKKMKTTWFDIKDWKNMREQVRRRDWK